MSKVKDPLTQPNPTPSTLLTMISGARYSGVPHMVHVLSSTRLAKPKSIHITHRPSKKSRKTEINTVANSYQ